MSKPSTEPKDTFPQRICNRIDLTELIHEKEPFTTMDDTAMNATITSMELFIHSVIERSRDLAMERDTYGDVSLSEVDIKRVLVDDWGMDDFEEVK
ncbi:hypothetical protein ADUPG1_007078 [Aduncisulcus paluster]|uniref:Uncharacterized protein n=1 Tax=Aduncisulcus paluster TaxID=2918883 RepID=A0ABQ5KKM3_9EUKA|nr:hypothetical protein ADUPG1_007078 [Aduncisulcus paluster]